MISFASSISNRSERDRERERAPLAPLALDPDAAAVGLDGDLAKRQSQSPGHPPPRLPRLYLTELFEDLLERLHRNPLTGVPHGKEDRLFLFQAPGKHCDPSAFR